MSRRLLQKLLVILVGTMLVLVGADLAAARIGTSFHYEVTDLGTLSSSDTAYIYAYDLNNKGQIIGLSSTSSGDRAFLWEAGKLTDLGSLANGISSRASGINEAGLVVGYAGTNDGKYQAVVWQGGKIQSLVTPPNSQYSFALDINNVGTIVGEVYTDDRIYPVKWDNNSVTDLGTLGGFGSADAINNAGEIVGESQVTGIGNNFHAFKWQAGKLSDLGTLPGGFESHASDINDFGQVVGQSDEGTDHAVLWDKGKVTDLGKLASDSGSGAASINNRGVIVGSSYYSSPKNSHAFVWRNGTMTDLNSLIPKDSGWVLVAASAINSKGQIVGYGYHNGQSRAFLLTPITVIQ